TPSAHIQMDPFPQLRYAAKCREWKPARRVDRCRCIGGAVAIRLIRTNNFKLPVGLWLPQIGGNVSRSSGPPHYLEARQHWRPAFGVPILLYIRSKVINKAK